LDWGIASCSSERDGLEPSRERKGRKGREEEKKKKRKVQPCPRERAEAVRWLASARSDLARVALRCVLALPARARAEMRVARADDGRTEVKGEEKLKTDDGNAGEDAGTR
jgi:hypothetical protein